MIVPSIRRDFLGPHGSALQVLITFSALILIPASSVVERILFAPAHKLSSPAWTSLS